MDNYIDLLNFSYDIKYISGLNNELKSLFLLGLIKKSNKSILLVTSTLYEANTLYKSINKHYKDTYLFPMDDFLTSVALAASPELKTNRLETLNQLLNNKISIVITNLMGYLRYLPSKKIYDKSFIKLNKGMQYDISKLSEKLYEIGYRRETITNTTGDMSIRGYVVDLFPIGMDNPIRIEFWGDEIDSIRLFDVNTQLTIENIDEIVVQPNTELIVSDTKEEIEYYEMPKYIEVSNITSYLNNPTIIFNNYHDIKVSYDLLKQEMFDYSISKEIDKDTKYMFSLNDFNVDPYYFEEFDEELNQHQVYKCQDIEPFKGDTEAIIRRLKDYNKTNKIVIVCANNRYQANKILDLDKDIILTNIDNLVFGKINVIIKKINSGFIYNKMVVISDNELFNRVDRDNVYNTKFKIGTKIRDITKLNEGDYVVHQIHGIGKYLGIKVLTKNGLKKDYLMIEYRDGDKLYIPVEKIDNITKYSSNQELIPKLSKFILAHIV